MSRPDQSITFLRELRVQRLSFSARLGAAARADASRRQGPDAARHGAGPRRRPATIASPDVRRDASPGIDIEGKETSKVNVAIGVSILGSFIGALGGGKLGLDVAFNKARTVTFQYTGVMEDVVDVLALEKFVKAGRISPHIPSGTLEKLLDDEVYVVTSVLKTKKIVVAAQGESGADVKVDVPVIQQAVGGTSTWTRRGTSESQRGLRGRRSGRVRVSGGAARVRRLRRVPDDAAAARGRCRGARVAVRPRTRRARVRSFSKPAAPSCAWRSKEER